MCSFVLWQKVANFHQDKKQKPRKSESWEGIKRNHQSQDQSPSRGNTQQMVLGTTGLGNLTSPREEAVLPV